jgi:hypothetical protein
MSILLFFNYPNLAQINDAGIWTSYTLRKKVSKRITGNVTEQIRFDQNDTRLSYYNTEVGMDFKIKEYLIFSPNYRFIHKRQLNGTFVVANRFFFDLTANAKYRKFTFSLRARFQWQYSSVYLKDFGFTPQYYNRDMWTIRYRLTKKFHPYISQEYFIALNGPYVYRLTSSMSYVGIYYRVYKELNLNLYYMVQLIRNRTIPRNNYITGIGITYSF